MSQISRVLEKINENTFNIEHKLMLKVNGYYNDPKLTNDVKNLSKQYDETAILTNIQFIEELIKQFQNIIKNTENDISEIDKLLIKNKVIELNTWLSKYQRYWRELSELEFPVYGLNKRPPGSGGFKRHTSSPINTGKKHKCSDGVLRTLYKNGLKFFVKQKINGTMTYKRVMV